MPGQGFFIRLGSDLISSLQVSKCHYMHYGPSGTLATLDVVCLLPYNQFAPKIFVVLYFW